MTVPIIFLVLGILGGRLLPQSAIPNVDALITASLAVLVFAAGVDVGSKKHVFRKLYEYRAKVLLIPLGTVLGSVLGGALLGRCLGMPVNEAAAVSAGLGYYSFSAVILTDMGGASLGALAFVSNIFREVLALLIIPFVARYISPHSAIAPGGATTMDTTLGVISRSTNAEITVMAMINGLALSVAVPVLVPLLFRLLSAA